MTEITICLGSSCFSRGNDKNLQLVKDFIDRGKIEANIDFKGRLCSNFCNRGPVIEINGAVFENVNENNLPEILETHLKK